MTTVESPPTTFIRQDGKEKVTVYGRYTADLNRTGQLHAAFRYADHTHARILRIDATRARELPGVLAVVTHEDVPDVLYGGMVQDRRLFARDNARYRDTKLVAYRLMAASTALSYLSMRMTQIVARPFRTEPNAIRLPSGDQAGE